MKYGEDTPTGKRFADWVLIVLLLLRKSIFQAIDYWVVCNWKFERNGMMRHWINIGIAATFFAALIFADIALSRCLPGHDADMEWIRIPIAMRTPAGTRTEMVLCSPKMRKPLVMALTCIKQAGLESHIRTFDGCYCYRNIAGTSRLSNHARGLAIDLNAAWNRRGQPSSMSPAVVKCFKDAGFNWGGDWPRPDSMHFEWRK
jgi:hypothetical protein